MRKALLVWLPVLAACSPSTEPSAPVPAQVASPIPSVTQAKPAPSRVSPPASAPDMLPPAPAIADTSLNREIIAVCERYRLAAEAQDADALLALASKHYQDGGGTPHESADDLDRAGLEARLQETLGRVRDVHYAFEYLRIEDQGEQVTVDYRYVGSYRVGDIERRIEDSNRLVLRREGAGWKIVSGM